MSARARRLLVALGIAALVLFAGRWLATLFADRWWAAEFSPAAADFVTEVRLLRLLLDVGGALVGATWFIGHFLIVYRAIAAVQVSRNVANLEIREAVPPRALLGTTVAAGAVLGILAGADLSTEWQAVVLGWEGIALGMPDPYLAQDVGVYLTQLPLWQLLHGFALLLSGVGLLAVFTLYGVIGAVRWSDGRPAVSDHARRHLGWLLGALAVVLAWGYLLEPFEWVAEGASFTARRPFSLVEVTAPILTGFALATALLSILWGYRARHSLFVAGWLLLIIASVTGHYVLPAVRTPGAPSVQDQAVTDRLSLYASDLEHVRDTALVGSGAIPGAPPTVPALWSPEAVRAFLERDTAHVVSVGATTIERGGDVVAAWLAVRASSSGGATVFGVRDDRVGTSGQATPVAAALHVADEPLLDLPVGSVRPEAPVAVLGERAPGPRVGAWPRRLALAWALQEPRLLGSMPETAHVAWQLTPGARLARLAPFAEWGTPLLRIIDGRPAWVAVGYVTSATFPGTPRIRWRDGETGMVRVGFVGLIDGWRGTTRIIARSDGGPLADAWTRLASGLVEPAAALPDAVQRVLTYPTELLQAQAPILAERDPAVGHLLSGPSGMPGAPAFELVWREGGASLAELVLYERADAHELSAMLEGRIVDGHPALTLWRIARAATLPSPSVLESRWARFVSFAQLRDSVKATQGSFEGGPVRFSLVDGQLVAIRSWIAAATGRPASVTWIAVATGEHLGAGRTLAEAWENLHGTLSPVPVGANASALVEARRWVRLADSALARGDFAAFGRAFDALRQALDAPAVPPR
jgi:uncharacterized membrane protein (UPF0182 family)